MRKRLLPLLLSFHLCGCIGLAESEPIAPVPTPDLALADAGPLPPDPPRPDGGSPPGRAGIVVIDVQESFVKSAANKDIDQIIDHAGSVLELAGRSPTTPTLITYEASKQNGLPLELKNLVPAHAQEFIKTTFAATGLASFAAAVKQSGLTHFVVLGAETDVCVLQTVLGLRALGYGVILQQDAVFSEETNTAPALRRMRQAGVTLAGMSEVSALLGGGALPPVPEVEVRRLKPFAVAVVLNHLQDAGLASVTEPYKTAKLARLRELLLAAEWFDVPIFGTATGLPASLQGLIKKPIRPLAELAQEKQVTQIVLAGTAAGLSSLIDGQAREVFLMEDALLGASASSLEAHYGKGAVPITYKSFYYEMTRSVSLEEWPARSWLDRFDEYYNKTKAPEDLPPIPG